MMVQYGLLVVVAVALVATGSNALPPQKIVGGTAAAPGEFPYQVSLRVNGKHFCGGTIISKRHVVTAAHCVVNIVTHPYNNLVVVTGSVNRNAGQTHSVKSVLYHSQYSTGSAASPNDIAIIALKADMTFNANQNKLGLPSANVPSGVRATVTGWGYTRAFSQIMSDVLLKTTVTTLTAPECQRHLAQTAILYTHQICAYGAPGQGVCQGDSGGPLAYNGQLIGVVSFNVPCGRGYPDVYSSIYHYIDWIRQVVAMA